MAANRLLVKVLATLAITLLLGSTAPWWWHKAIPSDAPPYMDEMVYGVYLPGNNLENPLAAEANTEESCSRLCLQDTRCKAMSFIEKPWGGGECRLKDKVPPRTNAPIAISAVKVYPL
jgi:hypothetical protein